MTLRLVALCAALMIAPATASAEWYLTPMAGVTFHGDTTFVDPEIAASKAHLQLGGAATLVGPGIFGVEAITVFTPEFFRGDAPKASISAPPLNPGLLKYGRSFALMGNAVLTAPRRLTEYSLRPFVSGGLGVITASHDGVIPVHSSLAGYNIGVGAVGFLSPRTGVRFDLRYYSTLHHPDLGAVSFGPVRLHYLTASIGVVFRH
jgi:hypothetical protein